MYYEEELSHVKISNITSIPATSIGNTIRIVLSKIQQHLRYKGIIKKTNI
jgi:DNA-directed RNA polymerase specialized sigma24 family protein